LEQEAREETSEEIKIEEMVSQCCGAPLTSYETDRGLRYKCSKCGKLTTPTKPEERRVPLKPLEAELTETVCEELEGRLDQVFGIPRGKVPSIVDTIRDNPNIALNPMNLFVHIKQLEGRANDYHLWVVISQTFEKIKAQGWTGGVVPPYPVFMQQAGFTMPTSAFHGYGYGQPYGGYGGYGGYPPQQTFDYSTERVAHLRRQDDREAREHELRMKKLEQEIKTIAESRSRGSGAAEEPKVKVKVGNEITEVPASVAPYYLLHREEEKVPVKFGETTINVPASLAPLYVKGEGEEVKKLREEVATLKDEVRNKEVDDLKGEIGNLYDKLDELSKRPGLTDELEKQEKLAERLGFKRSGMSVLDIAATAEKDIHTIAHTLVQRFPTPGGEFKPEVKRSPKEREKEAERIEKKIEKSEGLLKAENELIKIAAMD